MADRGRPRAPIESEKEERRKKRNAYFKRKEVAWGESGYWFKITLRCIFRLSPDSL